MIKFYLIDFIPQLEKTNVTHFVYVHGGYMYASPSRSNIPGFESVNYTGVMQVDVQPGECVHYFVRRTKGYAMISKFNPTDTVISFEFTSVGWYAMALSPAVSDVLTFFTDVGPFNVPADRLFHDYGSNILISGLKTDYGDMLQALSVTWSPGLSQGLEFSTEYNLELYEDIFNFNFTS